MEVFRTTASYWLEEREYFSHFSPLCTLSSLGLEVIDRSLFFEYLVATLKLSVTPPMGLIFGDHTMEEIESWVSQIRTGETKRKQNVGLLFSGQGCDFSSFTRTLITSYPPTRSLFARASDILGVDLLKVAVESDAEVKTEFSQLVIFVASVAALQKLTDENPDVLSRCAAVAGFSLGEYAALVCSGSLSFESALELVQQRALLMQRASILTPSVMVSVYCEQGSSEIVRLVEQVNEEGAQSMVEIAVFFCPKSCTVAGTQEDMARFLSMAAQKKMKTVLLKTTGAFHTSCMESARIPFGQIVREASGSFLEPKITLFSNVTGKPYQSASQVIGMLPLHLVRSVCWSDVVSGMLDMGCTQFYEVGPSKILLNNVNRIVAANAKGVKADAPSPLSPAL